MRKLFNSEPRLTQGFNARPEYYAQFKLSGHEGADYVPTSSDWSVFCLEDGVVVKDDDIAGDKRTDAYGKSVTIWHPKINKATQYCHLASNNVVMGQSISKGEKIGIMGDTGNTDGAHVHLNLFETDAEGYRKNTKNGFLGGVNPVPFMNEGSASVSQTPFTFTDQTKIPLNIKTDLESYGEIQLDQLRGKLIAKDAKIVEVSNDILKTKDDLVKYINQQKEEAANIDVTTTTYPKPATPEKEPAFAGPFVEFLKWLGKKIIMIYIIAYLLGIPLTLLILIWLVTKIF